MNEFDKLFSKKISLQLQHENKIILLIQIQNRSRNVKGKRPEY